MGLQITKVSSYRWAMALPVPNAIPCMIVEPIPDSIPPPPAAGAGGAAGARGAGGGAFLGAGGLLVFVSTHARTHASQSVKESAKTSITEGRVGCAGCQKMGRC